jgi:ribonuclease E
LGFAEGDALNADVSSTEMPQNGASSPRADGAPAREGRGRDRYGRERKPRQERTESEASGDSANASTPSTEPLTAVVADSIAAAPTAAQAPVPATVLKVVAPLPVEASDSAGRMPLVSTYALPLGQLEEVAQASGLQWVNSDADKIAAVQAAIAAEPQPLHAPRERPAPVAMDNSPLILVETRRDLRNMSLPFEQAPGA